MGFYATSLTRRIWSAGPHSCADASGKKPFFTILQEQKAANFAAITSKYNTYLFISIIHSDLLVLSNLENFTISVTMKYIFEADVLFDTDSLLKSLHKDLRLSWGALSKVLLTVKPPNLRMCIYNKITRPLDGSQHVCEIYRMTLYANRKTKVIKT